MAQKAGGDCVVACISPFEDLRRFARRKIPGYIEIYLKRDLEACMADDQKEVYRRNKGRTDIVGIDIAFEQPLGSDLVIDMDGSSEERVFDRIAGFLENKRPLAL
jgi:adenylylsulfate kinase-like enzyme